MSNIANEATVPATEKTIEQKESLLSRFFRIVILNSLAFVLTYQRRIIVTVGLILLVSAAYISLDRLTTPIKVQINNEGVAEKGWFSNLMWRKDSSKVINVEVQPGFDKTGVSVTAVRGNGEKTVMNSEGVWHLFE